MKNVVFIIISQHIRQTDYVALETPFQDTLQFLSFVMHLHTCTNVCKY